MRPLVLCLMLVAYLANVGLGQRIARRVPPAGLEIPTEVRQRVQAELVAVRQAFGPLASHRLAADIEIFIKAVELALEHGECYDEKHFDLLSKTLDLARARIDALQGGRTPWTHQKLTVRGFTSRIDDSPQPYGLVLPDRLPLEGRVPLYVWLHGRGDKTTDLHFIQQRLEKTGTIQPPGAIVLHPFGRQCIGFKSAGETDVLEAIEHVQAHYPIDEDRICLMGFSMGGAGTWHVGAHHTDRFVAISPGAGFAETAEYNRLSPDARAALPSYERTLWGVYDVPNYVRNFFGVPIVAYSGEKDKQIQAARVMERAFAAHRQHLPHVIGPGMGHKYHPDSLAHILKVMDKALAKGRNSAPRVVRLQTRTLRYAKMHWLKIDRLYEHWQDTSVTAEVLGHWIRVATADDQHRSNVVQLALGPLPDNVRTVVIDGKPIDVTGRPAVTLSRTPSASVPKSPDSNDHWRLGPASVGNYAKTSGLQGPIDDAFLDRFLVVRPTGPSGNEKIDRWVQAELEHLRRRWKALFRGSLPECEADEVDATRFGDSHLVLFGTPENNPLLAQVENRLPIRYEEQGLTIGNTAVSGTSTVPLMIYPNPLNPRKYVVLNSGPTFREAHDRTNSLQNPKLPDWAILDIRQPPDDKAAGRVVHAGFFDESWQPRNQ